MLERTRRVSAAVPSSPSTAAGKMRWSQDIERPRIDAASDRFHSLHRQPAELDAENDDDHDRRPESRNRDARETRTPSVRNRPANSASDSKSRRVVSHSASDRSSAVPVSSIVAGSRSRIFSRTGLPSMNDSPKSRRTACQSQSANCDRQGTIEPEPLAHLRRCSPRRAS